MIPKELCNPFLVHQLDDTVKIPAGDVPELHAHVLEKCRASVRDTRQVGRSLGLLVSGEVGSGKSHLIARFRQEVAAEPRAVLAAVTLYGAYSGRLWRHLRQQLLTELLRPYENRAHGANGLLRILRNQFPKWATSSKDGSGGMLELLLGKSRSATNLQPFIDEFAAPCPLDYGLQKVLPRLTTRELVPLANAWLRGEQLGAEDLAKLGLPPSNPSEMEQESNAREVVLSFARLAGEETILFLCFDQVEAIQAGNRDAGALREFTNLTSDLLGTSGPRVVATFIRPNLLLELSKAVEVSNLQKMNQTQTYIPPITWEQAVRIVLSRLDAEPTCQAYRRENVDNKFSPLDEPFVQGVYQEHRRSLTPRHLIGACRFEFERGQKGEGPRPPHDPPPDDLARLWDRRRKKLVANPQSIMFDTVMALGLPWLVKLTGTPLTRIEGQDPRFGDVNFRFQPEARGQKPLAISLCNHAPHPLWPRLDRLLDQWRAHKDKLLGSLVVLRSVTERTTAAAQTRLTSLTQLGARVVLVQPQQLAELAAFQGMMTAALDGDLTREGKPVEAAEFDRWAAGNLSDSVKELLVEVFDHATVSPARPATLDKRPKAEKV